MARQTVADSSSTTEKDDMERFAEQVRRLSVGDRALLRRLYLVQSSSSRSHQADGVVVGLLHRASIFVPEAGEPYEAWQLLAHVAALLTGTGDDPPGAHNRYRSPGEALQAAGYSENRLLRLTAARGAALVDQIVRAARVLAQGEQSGRGDRAVNLWTVFNLAGGRAVKAEAARLDIAKHYYNTAARAAEGDNK